MKKVMIVVALLALSTVIPGQAAPYDGDGSGELLAEIETIIAGAGAYDEKLEMDCMETLLNVYLGVAWHKKIYGPYDYEQEIETALLTYFVYNYESFLPIYQDYRSRDEINSIAIYGCSWSLGHIFKYAPEQEYRDLAFEALIEIYENPNSPSTLKTVVEGSLIRGGYQEYYYYTLIQLYSDSDRERATACWSIGFFDGDEAVSNAAIEVAIPGLESEDWIAVYQFLHALVHLVDNTSNFCLIDAVRAQIYDLDLLHHEKYLVVENTVKVLDKIGYYWFYADAGGEKG